MENSLFPNINKITKIDNIVKKLLAARKAYYYSDEPILNDLEFDSLEEELFNLDPSNIYFKKIGGDLHLENTIRHVIPMLSSDKAKGITDVHKWLKRLDLKDDENLVVEPKIDGLSATISYIKGHLNYVATRGDGQNGQNISHVAPYLNIPQTLNKPLTLEVRGELYLPKNTLFNTGGRPLRNNCVGLINRKENQEDLKYVKIAPYQIVGYDKELASEVETINLLKELGFGTVECFTGNIEEVEEYCQLYLDKLRSEWLYETDGLIIIVNNKNLHDEIDSRWVVDHHHHYAIALKPPSEMAISTLEALEWNVSRSGSVIPIAIFKTVILGGANISRASLHNADNVENLHLHIGDTLEVERANDVIPYIRSNLTAHDNMDISSLLISSCPSCKKSLVRNSVHLKCTNRDCPEVKIQQVLYWVKSCNMENIGESAIRTLFAHNAITSISDLYHLKASNFLLIDGFADKKINNFLSEVEKSKTMSTRAFITKLGIPMVAEKGLKRLKINSIDDFLAFNDATYIIGQKLLEWREDSINQELVKSLLSVITIIDESNCSLGEVCMTGKGPMGRLELEQKLNRLGYSIGDSVTKSTTLLLCDDINGNSSKLSKAKKLGIEIKLYNDFFKVYH